MSFLLTNYFTTTLSAAATNTATTLSITSTTNFPTAIPSGMYVPLSLLDAATKSVLEIVWATSITGSNITVLRGQEGTTAQAWLASDLIFCDPTAYSVNYTNGINGHNIISISAAYTLSTLQSGSTIDTSGASAAFILGLPASPVKGNFYSIISNGSYQITISPNGGTFIFNNQTTSTSNYNLALKNGIIANFFYDGSNWSVSDYGNQLNQETGKIIIFAGSSIPSGFLQIPTAATSISRTTYANLFNILGTTWGSGDGTTTFGMPWIPADYSIVQANANMASQTVGQLLSHYHTITGAQFNISPSTGNTLATNSPGTGVTTTSVGGAANLAAGVRFNFAIKY